MAWSVAACGGASQVVVPNLPDCSERLLPAEVFAALVEEQRVVDVEYAMDDDPSASLEGLFAEVLPEGARVVEVLRGNYLADSSEVDELLVLFVTPPEQPLGEEWDGAGGFAERYGHAWFGGLRCGGASGFVEAFAPVDLVFDSIPMTRQVDRVLLADGTPITAVSVAHELLSDEEMIESVYLFGPLDEATDGQSAGLWDTFEGVGERTRIPGLMLWYTHVPMSVSGFYPMGQTQVWTAIHDSLAWTLGDEDDEFDIDDEGALLDRDEDAPAVEPWSDEETEESLWTASRMLAMVPHGVIRDGAVEVWDPFGFIGPEVPWETWGLLGHGPLPPDCEKRLLCRYFEPEEQAVFALGGEQVEWFAGLLPTLRLAQNVADRLEGGALITGFSAQFDLLDPEEAEEEPTLEEIDERLRVGIPLPAFGQAE